jgi:exosortase
LRNTSNLVLGLKVSTLIAAVIALYFQDLQIVFADALANESTSYILIIPFLFAYLIYRKRRMLRTAMSVQQENYSENTRYFGVLGGILLCATAILFYWYGSYTFTPLEYHMLTLPVFAGGLTFVLFNPRTFRQACFPIAFLILLVPPPSEIIYNLGSTLSVISSQASNRIVNLLGVHTTVSSISGTPAIYVTQANGNVLPPITVDIACSGIYSLLGFMVFTAFVAFIARDKLWKKATIFFLGFPLIYLFNIIRITSILLIGYQWGEQLALNVFHMLSGWVLIFTGTLILLAMSEKIFRTQIFTKKQPRGNCQNCNPIPSDPNEEFCPTCGRLIKYPQARPRKTDAAKIAVISLVIIFLMSIQVPVFAVTQGPAQVLIQTATGQQGNSQIFPQIPNYTLQYLYRDTTFENLSGQDLSLIYSYTPQNPEKTTIFVAFEMAQIQWHLHPWEYCLVTFPQIENYPSSVEQLDLRDTQIIQNPSIIARYFAFKNKSDNQTQVVLYWYEDSIFETNGTSQEKYVEISLIAYPNTPQDVASMEDELLPFATALVNYWQPIKMWTAIAIALSRNSITLAEITITLLAAIIIFYTFETVRKRRANARAYQKLSSQNKQIINAVAETEKTKKPTLQAIAGTYESKTGLKIDEKDLLQKLSETEKTGIIESTTANVQDEPTRTWKTKITTTKSQEHKLLSVWKQRIIPHSKQ